MIISPTIGGLRTDALIHFIRSTLYVFLIMSRRRVSLSAGWRANVF